MENLDGTVIATALPHMAQSFKTGPVEVSGCKGPVPGAATSWIASGSPCSDFTVI
jgi:hypothetical protein